MYCAALSNTFLRAAESRAAVGSSEAVLERAAHEQFHWPPDNLKGGPRLGGIDGVDTKHQPAEANPHARMAGEQSIPRCPRLGAGRSFDEA